MSNDNENEIVNVNQNENQLYNNQGENIEKAPPPSKDIITLQQLNTIIDTLDSLDDNDELYDYYHKKETNLEKLKHPESYKIPSSETDKIEQLQDEDQCLKAENQQLKADNQYISQKYQQLLNKHKNFKQYYKAKFTQLSNDCKILGQKMDLLLQNPQNKQILESNNLLSKSNTS